MDTLIVIMLKNSKTGLFEKELTTLKIENEQYILNIYAMQNSQNEILLYLNLTTENDVQNWEYEAIYDYYDKDIFCDISLETKEKDEYNPTWQLTIKYPENHFELENILNKILEIHKNELAEVFSIIKDKKGEYQNEK